MNQEDLIQEEQEVLNSLIRNLDKIMLQLDKRLTADQSKIKKAKEKCLPDTYGMLIEAQNDKLETNEQKKRTKEARDALYEYRIIVEIQDENDKISKSKEEIKIGLHKYVKNNKVYILNWTDPLCQRFILDNTAEDYDNVVIDKYGKEFHNYYTLKMKRKIDKFFDKVTGVNHLYPLTKEEAEKIIADEFLQELLKRRTEPEFKNIVFSIQKKQGEIIQAPFKQNMIVQGCAGSGKSMIMLHRLPIILVNNPKGLNRNNLYIITPSVAYVQMAEQMRIDLEIKDLKMGTLEQYYDYVICKYGLKSEIYGKVKSYSKLPLSKEKYIYSEQCIADIKEKFEYDFNKGKFDYSDAQELFKLSGNRTDSNFISAKINSEILSTQEIINANYFVLKLYHNKLKICFEQLTQLTVMLTSRKVIIGREIANKISKEFIEIEKRKKDLEKIDKEEHKVKYSNCKNFIESSRKRIEDLRETQMIVDLDDSYFELLKKEAKSIKEILQLYSSFDKDMEKMSSKELYRCIENKKDICEQVEKHIFEIVKLGDPYIDYAESILSYVNTQVFPSIQGILMMDNVLLDFTYHEKLIESNQYYVNLKKNIVQDTYRSIMEQLGQKVDKNGKMTALSCSPYLYLQILYCYQGSPNGTKEELITIDEAQSVTATELQLIKEVNDNKVILNLFGDVKQHIEGSKGIDDWNEFEKINNFTIHHMNENYRNARQITDYCNHKFGMQMRAINTDGKGVHVLEKQQDLINNLEYIFTKPQNPGLSCIIVKDEKEADTIFSIDKKFQKRIHNMTMEPVEIRREKWNLMTAEQAKGLEFETVFALTGRMGENEKYITYTRALDELYIYDKILPLIKEKDDFLDSKIETQPQTHNERKKREKKGKKDSDLECKLSVKEFFESEGLEVIDVRKTTGFLWVIGEKSEIEKIVNKAIDKFAITGAYGSGKTSHFRSGWYTKTKK